MNINNKIPNTIQKLRLESENAWIEHFNACSDKGIWKELDISLTDIKVIEQAWKLRWIEKNLNSISEIES